MHSLLSTLKVGCPLSILESMNFIYSVSPQSAFTIVPALSLLHKSRCDVFDALKGIGLSKFMSCNALPLLVRSFAFTLNPEMSLLGEDYFDNIAFRTQQGI